jgi:phytoene dehydrogenase-like protein
MSKKVIIIGGGIAGLSAGIYGQLNGYDTEIIEMHTIPGGQCTAWTRKGFRFDYCLHWLVGTAKGVFNDLWKETNVINGSVKIIDHEIHTRIRGENGEEFIIYTNLDKWEKYLLDIAPDDAKSIKKMCNDMRKSSSLDFIADPPGMRSLKDYVRFFKNSLPILLLMGKYGKKNCKEYFAELNFKNSRLKFFFNALYAERDFSAIAFLMMLAWFNQKNAGYLIGGSLPLTERMADKYKSLGGKFTFGKKVSKILVENDCAKGIQLTDGTKFFCDYVISAADGHSTIYDMLESKYISKEIKEAYDTWSLFTPLVQVSFGIKDKINSEYPVQTFVTKKSIGSTRPDYGYSLMNYCFDSTMAPEGKTTIILRFESPWEIWEKMNEEDYAKEKEMIKTDAIALLEKEYPGITDKIEVIDIATPKTDVEYTGVWKGSYEGFMPTSKNISKNLKMTLPNLNNFYMIGQWLFPGGGLPPSVQSGKWVFQLICKKEKKEFRKAL